MYDTPEDSHTGLPHDLTLPEGTAPAVLDPTSF